MEEGGCPGSDAEWEKPASEDRMLCDPVYAAFLNGKITDKKEMSIARHGKKREREWWL